MKKTFSFAPNETFGASLEDLYTLRERYEQYLQNYAELVCSMEDDAYIARGNGFCDSKFSESFLEEQMAKYRTRIEMINQWIKTF